MNLNLAIQVALREMWAHKFRSFLTMLGIIMGVASLVSMFAVTEGMTRGMKEFLTFAGGIEQMNVAAQEPPASQVQLKDLSPGRTLDDAKAIRQQCSLITAVSPEVQIWTTIQYMNREVAVPTTGVTDEFIEIKNYDIEQGRFISDLDQDVNNQCCVIGWPIWEQLRQSRAESPIGKTIQINNLPFYVVGVFRDYETAEIRSLRQSGKLAAWEKRRKERRSSYMGLKRSGLNHSWRVGNIVVIPLSTMQALFKSGSINPETGEEQKGPDRKLTHLNLKAKNSDSLAEAIEQVKSTLLRTHRGIEDFGFDTQESWSESIDATVRAARLSGGIIAGISLLVGGIGIANIMLASITERIREIGIRMAIGARSTDIFLQILIESSSLGFLGGLIGLLTSVGVVGVIKQIAELSYEPIIPFQGMMISFGFAVLTGILAGIYPAIVGARLDPIQALRYE